MARIMTSGATFEVEMELGDAWHAVAQALREGSREVEFDIRGGGTLVVRPSLAAYIAVLPDPADQP